MTAAEFWQWLENLKGATPTVVGTALGWALGLVALTLGSMLNARAARRRDDRLRAVESRTAAAALDAELQMMEQTLRDNAASVEAKIGSEEKGTFFAIPNLGTSVRLFPLYAHRLGDFGTTTALKINQAYALLFQYGEKLTHLGAKSDKNFGSESRMLNLDSQHAETFVAMNRKIANELREAREELARTVA